MSGNLVGTGWKTAGGTALRHINDFDQGGWQRGAGDRGQDYGPPQRRGGFVESNRKCESWNSDCAKKWRNGGRAATIGGRICSRSEELRDSFRYFAWRMAQRAELGWQAKHGDRICGA